MQAAVAQLSRHVQALEINIAAGLWGCAVTSRASQPFLDYGITQYYYSFTSGLDS